MTTYSIYLQPYTSKYRHKHRCRKKYRVLFEMMDTFPAVFYNFTLHWFVESEMTVAEIREMLTPFIDKQDKLTILVCDVVSPWVERGLRGESLW